MSFNMVLTRREIKLFQALLIAIFFAGCSYRDRPTPDILPTPLPHIPTKPTQTINPNFILEEEAIERAIEVNNTGHLSQQETPRILSVEIVTYQEAQKAVKGEDEEYILNQPLEIMVWLVRLSGKWIISGGPAATEKVPAGKETPAPLPPFMFTTCYAILDANTGELFVNGCRDLSATSQPGESSMGSGFENPYPYPVLERETQEFFQPLPYP